MTDAQRCNAAIAVGLALRVGVACWNAFDGPSLGASVDAVNFHRFAVAFALGVAPPRYDLTGFWYAYALGYVYSLTGPSVLLGSLLSCAAWLASAVTFRAALRAFGAGELRQFQALAVYAVLPSAVLWTSVTLREPYQLLCVNGMLLASARLMTAPSPASWLLLLVSIIFGALLHGAVLVLGVVVAGSLLMRICWLALRRPAARIAVASIVAIAAAGGGVVAFRTVYQKYNFDGGLAMAMEHHFTTGMRQQSRTEYIDDPRVDGTLALFPTVAVSTLKYLFEPMPWKMTHWFDAGFLAENVMRALCLLSAAIAMVRLRGPHRGMLVLVLTWYFAIEATWAVGTFNWGTAARHHVPATGLLLTAALAFAPGPFRIAAPERATA